MTRLVENHSDFVNEDTVFKLLTLECEMKEVMHMHRASQSQSSSHKGFILVPSRFRCENTARDGWNALIDNAAIVVSVEWIDSIL